MSENDLDRVREMAEGGLSPDDEEALRARAKEDAGLREVLEGFRGVSAVLGPAAPEPPMCRVTFAHIERRIERADGGRRRTVRWAGRAVAALVLVAIGWAGARSLPDGPVETVRLESVSAPDRPERPDRVAEAALAGAELLAGHVPLSGGEIHWIGSLQEGRAVARVTGRPILLFIHHPLCPICEEIEATALRDPAVRERIASFTAVKVLASFEAPDPEIDRDWPYFAVLGADGFVLDELRVPAPTQEYVAFLDDQIERRVPSSAMAWDRTRELARRLSEAVRAGREGPLGRSQAMLRDLAADSAAGPFAAAARAALARRAREARESRRDAAVAAASHEDRPGARGRLEAAVARFAGTPYEHELAAVLDALVRTGRFPRLDPVPLR